MNENKQAQQGSGSAENRGSDRDDQRHSLTNPDKTEKKDIAGNISESKNHLAGLKDLGQLSGRDDYAGGSGDDMSSQSTGEKTDR